MVQYVRSTSESNFRDPFKHPALGELDFEGKSIGFDIDGRITFPVAASVHESRAISIGAAIKDCLQLYDVSAYDAGLGSEKYEGNIIFKLVEDDKVNLAKLRSVACKIREAALAIQKSTTVQR